MQRGATLVVHGLHGGQRIEGFAGTSPWILSDFRSPRRPLAGVQDGFNRKGLMSEKGEPKQAFHVLRDYYRQKAGNAPP